MTARHDTLANFRHLGGLPSLQGVPTRPAVLYRSDAPLPGDLPPTGAPVWPPALVLDLRSADEPVTPHALDGPGTLVRRFPLMAEARPGTFHALRARGALDLDGLYADMLGRTAAILPEMLDLALSTEGPVLVHCTAGRDRTGVVVAVLLAAAGVGRDAVIADYALTGANMERVRPRMPPADQEVVTLSADLSLGDRSPTTAIVGVLDRLDSAGGPQEWLATVGIGAATCATWRTRLVG